VGSDWQTLFLEGELRSALSICRVQNPDYSRKQRSRGSDHGHWSVLKVLAMVDILPGWNSESAELNAVALPETMDCYL
jgi:hypothetical protein